MPIFSSAPPSFVRVLFRLVGANMNSTTDQVFTKQGTFSTYMLVPGGRCYNLSASATSAVGGLYTGAGKTGIILVAASQAYTGATTTTTGQFLALNNEAAPVLSATPILSLSTPHGSAVTADFALYGIPLS